MQRFKHLKIYGESKVVKKLLETLKEKKSTLFEYNRSATEDYANNIFRDVADVGCFKSNRASLFQSCVWVLVDNNHLVVPNITSEINSSLSKSDYNHVIDTFLNDFVIPEIKTENAELQIKLTPGEMTMKDLVSDSSFQLLNQWQASYDRYYMEEDFLSYGFWIQVIVSLVKNNDIIEYDDLREWLIDDCGWSEGLEDKIHDFYLRYEIGRDVLNEWKNENEG